MGRPQAALEGGGQADAAHPQPLDVDASRRHLHASHAGAYLHADASACAHVHANANTSAPTATPTPTPAPTATPTATPVPLVTLTATRGANGDTASVSWTAYGGSGFSYYRFIVCDASQYDGASCSGAVFRSDPYYDVNATGPVTVTGLNAGTGYGVILQVWHTGETSVLKPHATLTVP